MALNRIYKETERNNRARTVPDGTRSGDPLLIDTRPAVAITDEGGATKSFTLGGLTVSGLDSGGVGLKDNEASLAFDGTFEFAVTGATTSTAQGVVVYITSGNTLTTTAGSNTRYGVTDYPVGYFKRNGYAPVRVGG